ncbi:MAG: hypothetical protein CFE25_01710 [Chitinophagaceae bacterium BSSC1]|nr:MAG: hypothetical protein CFE25_01710 [Chitinophagaceae bacterium BSSC1]
MHKQTKVKVGIDILDLRFAKTGQKTILEEYYLQFLQNTDPSISFVFLDAALPQFSRSSKMGIILNHLIYQSWKQILLPYKSWRNKVDVLFCCDYFAPNIRLGFKNVQVFHDAFFYEYPTHYHKLWMSMFKALAIPAAKNSAFIITMSEYAKSKIHELINIPLNKLVVIYPGPKSLPKLATIQEDHLFTPPTDPYILHVGVWEKRKNIPSLLKAFRLLLDQTQLPFKLVLVGAGNHKMHSDDTEAIENTIQQLALDAYVVCTGYLSDQSLSIAYSHASLYVFPSYNEGFGLPTLEAFKFNLPVLVANNSCLPEVGGDAVIAFNPYSSEDLANKMQEVLSNPSLQESLKEKGRQRLNQFSWTNASNQLKEVFKIAAQYGE